MLNIFTPISQPVPVSLAKRIDDECECSSHAFVPDETKPKTWLSSPLKIVKCGSVSEGFVTLCSHHERVLKAHTPKYGEAEFDDIDQISEEEIERENACQSKWRKILGSIVFFKVMTDGMKMLCSINEVTNRVVEKKTHAVKNAFNVENVKYGDVINSTSSAFPSNINKSLNDELKNDAFEVNSIVLTENNGHESFNKTEQIDFGGDVAEFKITSQKGNHINNASSISNEDLFIKSASKNGNDEPVVPMKKSILCFRESLKSKEFKIKINWNEGVEKHSKELLCNKPIMFEIPSNATEVTLCHPLFKNEIAAVCSNTLNSPFTVITNDGVFEQGSLSKNVKGDWLPAENRYVDFAQMLLEQEHWEDLKCFSQDFLSERTEKNNSQLENKITEYRLIAERKLSELEDIKSKNAVSICAVFAVGTVAARSLIYVAHKQSQKQKRQKIKFQSLPNVGFENDDDGSMV